MAFGYALLKGRGGAAGYARESGGKRVVSARNLQPETVYSLYAVQDGDYKLCGTETADGSGNAKWTAPMEGSLFVAEENKVLLWDGGDDAFLQASAWLEKQTRKARNRMKSRKRQQISYSPNRKNQRNKKARRSGLIPCVRRGRAKPVDTLPERQRR
jgi:hypothetical protein